MTDNDIFRPNSSIRPTTGPVRVRPKPDLVAAGRRLQRWTWLLMGAGVVCVAVAFAPIALLRNEPLATTLVIGGLLTVSGLGWLLAVAHLGGTVAAANTPAEETPPVPDPNGCPACGFQFAGEESACPDCGIALK
jgi:hypothetical protein